MSDLDTKYMEGQNKILEGRIKVIEGEMLMVEGYLEKVESIKIYGSDLPEELDSCKYYLEEIKPLIEGLEKIEKNNSPYFPQEDFSKLKRRYNLLK